MAAGSPETEAAATASVPVAHALPSIEELLPAKTPLEMMLEDPIDERSTTVGSKLSFTVLRDIKKERKVILPRGATAMGHVTRILRQTYSLNPDLFRAVLP
jgi:hypothetical protein